MFVTVCTFSVCVCRPMMWGGIQLSFCALALVLLVPSSTARCDRTPEGNPYARTTTEGRFQIQISGNPETYVPGVQYTGKRCLIPKSITINFCSKTK